jgi:hypothetical protein
MAMYGAWIAQSVQRQDMDWTTEESEFESRHGQEFSLLPVVQTGSAVHPASYPKRNWWFFPRGLSNRA